MRHTVDSNWSMCPLVVSEWRKSTGTNGTSTWAKSMRIRAAGIVSSGWTQTPHRTDITEVLKHEHRHEKMLFRHFSVTGKEGQESCPRRLTFSSFVHREELERLLHREHSEAAAISVHRDESSENHAGLRDNRALHCGCSACLTWQSDLRAVFSFSSPKTATAKCVKLPLWLTDSPLQCQLDFKCWLWGNILQTWAVPRKVL